MDQLMVQVERRGSRPCGVEGDSLVEVWRGGKVLVACGARPFPEGPALCKKGAPLSERARPYCLFDWQGLKPLQEVW